MSYQAPTQSSDTITHRYAAARYLDSIPHVVAAREERLTQDMADYKAERRMKAIRRYLKERAAR